MFNQSEKEQIAIAIEKAELQTSGEIRVVIEKTCKNSNALEAAWAAFEKLNMHKTRLRNGVLIYLAEVDKTIAIIGDQGIHQKVPAHFWDMTKDTILSAFKKGDFVQGMIDGVTEAGNQLKKYFPRLNDDINELPNDIVILD